MEWNVFTTYKSEDGWWKIDGDEGTWGVYLWIEEKNNYCLVDQFKTVEEAMTYCENQEL